MSDVVARGTATAHAENDHTVHVDVDGLEPGATYHYRFESGAAVPWDERRDAALRARWEWLPARPPDPHDRTRVFRAVEIGRLAHVMLLDIRGRRDEPVRDPEMSEPGRTMLGPEQREWLLRELETSDAAWRIVATPSIFTRTWCDEPDEPLRTALEKLKLIDEDGEGPDHASGTAIPPSGRGSPATCAIARSRTSCSSAPTSARAWRPWSTTCRPGGRWRSS